MSGRPAAQFPMPLQSWDQGCRAGPGCVAGAGGKRGDPAGVWLRSNPGDYYRWDTHTYTHTLMLVFAAGVSPDSSWSEVITCPGPFFFRMAS